MSTSRKISFECELSSRWQALADQDDEMLQLLRTPKGVRLLCIFSELCYSFGNELWCRRVVCVVPSVDKTGWIIKNQTNNRVGDGTHLKARKRGLLPHWIKTSHLSRSSLNYPTLADQSTAIALNPHYTTKQPLRSRWQLLWIPDVWPYIQYWARRDYIPMRLHSYTIGR